MDKKGRLSRLGAKLVGMSVLGLVLAFAVFYLLDGVVTPWLLYSERFAPFWLRRNAALIQTYQDYVTENDLTVQQVVDDREGRLQAMGEGIYTIVVGTPSVVEFPVKAMEPSALPDDASYHFSYSTVVGFTSSSPANDSVEFLAELHQIQCADGVLFVSNSPMIQRYEGVGRLTGLLLALACFCVVVVPYIVRLLRRIGALSRETGFLMAGDLDHAINVKGRDELSALGEDIERLRLSVLARLEGEREAVGANARLITSLSHDIRTPLTKLTGYLDILSYGKYRSQAERDEFLRLASEKAAQLKALTDQLFASAQVAAPASGLEQPPEAVDGGALLGQLLTEQCDDLRREGFTIQPPEIYPLPPHGGRRPRLRQSLLTLPQIRRPRLPHRDHLEGRPRAGDAALPQPRPPRAGPRRQSWPGRAHHAGADGALRRRAGDVSGGRNLPKHADLPEIPERQSISEVTS